jgi:hypothetical protein
VAVRLHFMASARVDKMNKAFLRLFPLSCLDPSRGLHGLDGVAFSEGAGNLEIRNDVPGQKPRLDLTGSEPESGPDFA